MAKKTIQVEILKTVAGIGKQGEIKEVGQAQARNQLIPQWIAREVKEKGSAGPTTADRKDEILEKKDEIVAKLKDQTLEVAVEGHGWKISHHFDEKNVAQAIRQKYHFKLLPEMIQFDDVKHPKKAGEYAMHIDIAADAFVRMKLIITVKD